MNGFAQLAKEWKHDTSHLSSLEQRSRHSAYQAILNMGHDAIPMLINELLDDPDDWFSALDDLTGEDVVPEESYGDFDKMTAAWIQWAKDNRYV